MFVYPNDLVTPNKVGMKSTDETGRIIYCKRGREQSIGQDKCTYTKIMK